jgi:glycosyltransferase involved in cell wall biosynthesis
MKILFIHQNFPGQFIQISKALAKKGCQVKALAITGENIEGVELLNYQIIKKNTPQIHPLAIEFETKIIRAEACALAMLQLKKLGFVPDVIMAHPGWGESLFAKEIFPKTKLVHFVEFHYGKNTDSNFDPEFKSDELNTNIRLRTKNANNLLALDAMDFGISPTRWQASTIPETYQKKINVIFDGINTELVKPDPEASLKIKVSKDEELLLQAGDEIITYIGRNLEPYRGYHSFMRSLPQILKTRPNAKVIIVGSDGVSYGAPPPKGKTWKQIFLEEVKDKVDLNRIIFVGSLPYATYLKVLQISRVHVYLTYPFVMSWSCVEAMSAGCLIVGSKTPPVEEFITHNKNGLLVDFFNYKEIASTVCDALEHYQTFEKLRKNARQHIVDHYDLEKICLPKQIQLLESFFK